MNIYDPHQSQTRGRGVGWGVVVVIAVVSLFCGCLGGFLLGVSSFFLNLFENHPELSVTVTTPDVVVIDEPFTVEIEALDLAQASRTITSVSFEGQIVPQFEITTASPPTVSVNERHDYREFGYVQPVVAGGSTVFKFTLTPKRLGSWSGVVTVYDADYDWVEASIFVDVTEPNED